MITSNGIIFAITKIVVLLASKAAKSVIWRSWNRRKKNEREMPSTQGTDLEILSLSQILPRVSIAFLEGKTENNSADLIREIE